MVRRAQNRRTALLLLVVAMLLPTHGAEAGSAGAATAEPSLSGCSQVEITDDGAWCWFGDPRAVFHEGEHRRTYVGWVTSRGDIRAGSYDHETGEVRTSTVREKFQQNDHASPALTVSEDGRVRVFYSTHRGDRIYYRESVSPEDVSSWGDEMATAAVLDGHGGYTYPSPMFAPDGSLFLLSRGPGYQPTLLISSGERWDTGRELIYGAGERPYAKYARSGNVVHMAFTDGHPRLEPQNGIHYARLEGGEFRRADGTRITGLDDVPFPADAADTVYDGGASGTPAWVWDVAADALGRPIVVSAVFPEDGEHRYRYARWNGLAWEDHEIVPAGPHFPTVAEGEKRFEPHYSGGIALDHGDPSTVYLSRPIDGIFEIERWVTDDGGASWDSEAVTAGSSANNVRPFVPLDRTEDGPRVLWMRGGYADYASFDTAIVAEVATGEPTATEQIMKRVFRREAANLRDERAGPDPDWKQAVFMVGVVAAHEATGDSVYRDAALVWSEANAWLPGPRARHADDHCAGQVYIAMRADGGARALDGIRGVFEAMVDKPGVGREEWSWCDALFMSPPAMAQLSEATGNSGYVDLMDGMWRDAQDLLYDPDESLFYRDERAIRHRDGTSARTWRGNKIMWSRGNGWVLAGTARVLAALPESFESRSEYERLFVGMAERVVELQGEGGLWGSSLLDPADSQPAETSGSALFCYALAWGVRTGLLDPARYVPTIERTWTGLVSAVSENGELGWVQPPGTGPAMASAEDHAVYGSGAFLLAASEVLRLERQGTIGRDPN